MKKHIIVVEDDAHIRLGLCDALRGEGYEVSDCRDGLEAGPLIKQTNPDLVILDIMLPGKSGFDLCREIRAGKDRVPILMLSAKGQEIDKVVGLELGADDYVTKPFGVRELLARVQALLRRAGPIGKGNDLPAEIAFGTVRIDGKALRGKRGKEQFELTPRELKVLAVLFRERGNAVSRDALLNEVWGIEYYGTTRTLDQLIVKLRQKIEDVPGRTEAPADRAHARLSTRRLAAELKHEANGEIEHQDGGQRLRRDLPTRAREDVRAEFHADAEERRPCERADDDGDGEHERVHERAAGDRRALAADDGEPEAETPRARQHEQEAKQETSIAFPCAVAVGEPAVLLRRCSFAIRQAFRANIAARNKSSAKLTMPNETRMAGVSITAPAPIATPRAQRKSPSAAPSATL
jgi:DNA-binding response OmpR family regulator